MRDVAVTYAARGWSVIPIHWVTDGVCSCALGLLCRSAGKHPIERQWQARPRMNAADVYTCWNDEYPLANVGLVTGHASQFFVLDIDPKDGGTIALAELEAEYGALPDTYSVETGSGGAHYYFKLPDFALTNSASGLPHGIDIRGNGGQVVAPPSVSGVGPYLLAYDLPIASAPDWLLDRLRPVARDGPTLRNGELPDRSSYSDTDIARFDRYVNSALSGIQADLVKPAQWDNTVFAKACRLVELANSPWTGLTHAEVEERLHDWAPTDDDFTSVHVAAKWRSAMRTVVDKAVAEPEDRPSGGTPITPEMLHEAAVESASEHRLMIDGAAFILDIPDDVPAIWGKGQEVVWAEGESLMLAGQPGVGKTTLAGQLIKARLGIGAHEVLGMPIVPSTSKVLYLAMDRPAQVARALRRIFTEHDRDALRDRLLVWKGPPPHDVAKNPEVLLELALEAGADTIVIDSMKDAAIGLTEDEVGASYNRARQAALAAGVQVLELHHTIKKNSAGGRPDSLADIYGSFALTAGAGSVVLLVGVAGDPIVEWSHLKQPAEPVGPFKVLHDHAAGTSAIWNSTDLLAMMRARGSAGLTARDAAVAMFETDSPADNQVMKARRKLEGYAKADLATKTAEFKTTGGGPQRAATWVAVQRVTERVTAVSLDDGVTEDSEGYESQETEGYERVTRVTNAKGYESPPLSIGGGSDPTEPLRSLGADLRRKYIEGESE